MKTNTNLQIWSTTDYDDGACFFQHCDVDVLFVVAQIRSFETFLMKIILFFD